MATTFIKGPCLLTFNTDGAIKIEGIWRHAKGYYDRDVTNSGRMPYFTCPFENGYMKAVYPDFVVFGVNPTEEHIRKTICEYNIDELSAEHYRNQQIAEEAEARRNTTAMIEQIVTQTQRRRGR